MNQQFYDLSINALDDGTIRLEQRDYCGESAIVDLHPAQLTYIADSLSAHLPERVQEQPSWAIERIATLERRLLWVRDRFEECHVALPSDIYERCGDAYEFDAWLAASIDVTSEFCADFIDTPINAHITPREAFSVQTDDRCLPSTSKLGGEHPEPASVVRNGELFSDSSIRQGIEE
jgi:hypothetical protein